MSLSLVLVSACLLMSSFVQSERISGLFDLEMACDHAVPDVELLADTDEMTTRLSRSGCFHMAWSAQLQKTLTAKMSPDHMLADAVGLLGISLTGDVEGSILTLDDGTDAQKAEWQAMLDRQKSGEQLQSARDAFALQDAVAACPSPRVTSTFGNRTQLVILMDFADHVGAPISTTDINLIFLRTQEYFMQNSFNQASFKSMTVVPTVRMPQYASWYAANNFANNIRDHAQQRATALGHDTTCYDSLVYVFKAYSGGPGWWGLAMMPGRDVWISYLNYNAEYQSRVFIHELGHSFGLGHSSLYVVSDGNSVSPSGANSEYGDDFDVMGNGGNEGHYGVWYKVWLKWLKRGIDTYDLAPSVASYTTILHPFDQISSLGRVMGLSTNRTVSSNTYYRFPGPQYWFGTRSLITSEIGKIAIYIQKGVNDPRTFLISMDPTRTSQGITTNAYIAEGKIFSDCAEKMTVTNGGNTPCPENPALKCTTITVNRYTQAPPGQCGGPVVNTCTSSSCSGRGSCAIVNNAPVCTCNKGFSGSKCETTTCTGYDLCGAHGTCNISSGNHTCVCKDGYRGDFCQTAPDTTVYCHSNSCSGHGNCTIVGGYVKCDCEVGWVGLYCGTNNVTNTTCASDSCSGHGTCKLVNNVPSCTCDTSWTGTTCDTATCTGYTSCGSNGACGIWNNTLTCQCKNGYIGETCQTAPALTCDQIGCPYGSSCVLRGRGKGTFAACVCPETADPASPPFGVCASLASLNKPTQKNELSSSQMLSSSFGLISVCLMIVSFINF